MLPAVPVWKSQGSCVFVPKATLGYPGLGEIRISAARAGCCGSGDDDWSLMRKTILCGEGGKGLIVTDFAGKWSALGNFTR